MIFQITWLVSEWKSSLATYIKADKVKQQRPNKKEETDFVTEADPTQTGVAHRYRTFVDGILKYNMIVNTLFLSNILVVDCVKRISYVLLNVHVGEFRRQKSLTDTLNLTSSTN